MKRIVIVGGGFAGINLANEILKCPNYQVILIDKNNYNFFPPLIYQLATGFLETSSISYPFRKFFRNHANFQFRLGEVIEIDASDHVCYLNNGQVNYDYLVFASGTETNYFGKANVKNQAIPMKTVNDALRMRNLLLQNLEQASVTTDPREKKKLLNIVVAGGGPTGVEVTGMLAELRKYIFVKDYPELAEEDGQIYLVNGGPRLLEPMSEASHAEACKVLRNLGVKIKLSCLVEDVDDGHVKLSDGDIIESRNLIWAAGIVGRVFPGIPVESIGQGKRMIADAYNRVQGIADVYAIGDICIQKHDSAFPHGHPQLAQTAIQQGINLARNLIRVTKGNKLVPFVYKDKGNMAIIGRSKAVCDLFKSRLHLGGFIALLMWLFVHLTSLINYRNKLRTFYNWAAAYFTRDQSFRMIIRADEHFQNRQPLVAKTI